MPPWRMEGDDPPLTVTVEPDFNAADLGKVPLVALCEQLKGALSSRLGEQARVQTGDRDGHGWGQFIAAPWSSTCGGTATTCRGGGAGSDATSTRLAVLLLPAWCNVIAFAGPTASASNVNCTSAIVAKKLRSLSAKISGRGCPGPR